MTYEREREKMGITIEMKSDRKNGNGAKGSGRKGSTGWKAIVHKQGCKKEVLKGPTATELLQIVRAHFNIPPHITINRKGQTCI